MSGDNKDIYGRQIVEVRQFFGDYPIIEATADTFIYVSADDAAMAIPGDARRCSFANACKRSYGSRGVLFYKTVAYIDMKYPVTGEHVVFRFAIKEETRKAIEALDLDGDRREGTFRLYAISKSNMLKEIKRRRDRQSREREERKRRGEPRLVSHAKSAAMKQTMEKRRAAAGYGLRDGAFYKDGGNE